MAAANSTTSTPSHHASKRVLIIRPSALGDVARTVPVLTSLRKHFGSSARIDWLVNKPFIDIIAHHPAITNVIPFDRTALKKFCRSPRATRLGLALAKQLRSTNYDLVFDLQGLARSGLLTFLTRSKRRIGYRAARELAWLGYNTRHPLPHNTPHTVDQMLALLQAEGIKSDDDLSLYTSIADDDWTLSYLHQNNAKPNRYICIAPTARWQCKCWPIDRYAEISKRLLEAQSLGKHIVLLTAPSEQSSAEAFINTFQSLGGSPSQILNPTTSIGQLMSLIKHCRLVVCNDSAPLHIAVGFNKPITTIFGPTDPNFVGPYRRLETVVRPIETINPDFVFDYRSHKNDQSLIAKVTTDEVWQNLQQQIPSL
ncbi:glycosyltransferase family 9 protein [Poriferisphaera sp. WC338]|uniref:glycosyltransferase family 9 protein n=1 Tax=Poriferisphaera sp. WC338 TaxID=3425129 RepID=UPI003D8129C8